MGAWSLLMISTAGVVREFGFLSEAGHNFSESCLRLGERFRACAFFFSSVGDRGQSFFGGPRDVFACVPCSRTHGPVVRFLFCCVVYFCMHKRHSVYIKKKVGVVKTIAPSFPTKTFHSKKAVWFIHSLSFLPLLPRLLSMNGNNSQGTVASEAHVFAMWKSFWCHTLSKFPQNVLLSHSILAGHFPRLCCERAELTSRNHVARARLLSRHWTKYFVPSSLYSLSMLLSDMNIHLSYRSRVRDSLPSSFPLIPSSHT